MRHAAGPAGPTTLAAALTAIADAENAAIYGYSTQGPRLATPAERAVARGYYDVHRAQLQSVVGWIVTYVGSAASVPPPASVKPNAPSALPLASSGSHCCFCSSLPKR